MAGLQGRLVEISAGSGTNLSYYPAAVQIEATEPDPHMLKRARDRAAELGVTNITVQQAPAEKLPFDDASFDQALCTWVLCTVDDLPATLGEIRRVLKPEGTFRFMEHVGNDDSAFWGGAECSRAGVALDGSRLSS